MGLGTPVQRHRRRQVERGDLDPLEQDLLDQHAELGAPVADVVLGDHGVPLGAQHPGETVADDRGAQVADVHRLGHVRRRVVDHHPLRAVGALDHLVRTPQDLRDHAGQDLRPQADVDEPRAGDLQWFAQVGHVHLVDDPLGDLARRASLGLGQPQSHVALEVPELGLGRRTQFGVDPGDGMEAFGQHDGQRQHRGYPPARRWGCRNASTSLRRRSPPPPAEPEWGRFSFPFGGRFLFPFRGPGAWPARCARPPTVRGNECGTRRRAAAGAAGGRAERAASFPSRSG